MGSFEGTLLQVSFVLLEDREPGRPCTALIVSGNVINHEGNQLRAGDAGTLFTVLDMCDWLRRSLPPSASSHSRLTSSHSSPSASSHVWIAGGFLRLLTTGIFSLLRLDRGASKTPQSQRIATSAARRK
jgi:hypothetical protein